MITQKEIKILSVILAGGRSQRMGSDKALVFINNTTLLDQVYQRLLLQMKHYNKFASQQDAIIISTNNPILLAKTDKIYVPDDEALHNLGPLSGIYSALHYAAKHNYQAILTLAVDTPFFPQNYYETMVELYKKQPQKAIIVEYENTINATFALWPIDFMLDLKNHLHEGQRSIYSFALKIRANHFTFKKQKEGEHNAFFNINTPDDLKHAQKIWSQER